MIQEAKNLVLQAWRAGAAPARDAFAEALDFHGPAPFDAHQGRDAAFASFYEPLAQAFPEARRDQHVFLGGVFEGGLWVASFAELVGEQRAALADVPAGPGERRLRIGEFFRVEEGVIVETRCLIDLLGLADQAGFALLPPFPAAARPPLAPALGNGVCLDAQDPATSADTLALIEAMLGGCNALDGSDLESMGMAAYWHDDMVWHGPWGVGSCFGFREFQDYCQGPSVASFPNRRGGFHRARFAEGLTGAFTGWPSLRGDFTGEPFRGIAPTGGRIGQNIMDFYVRRGPKLHENWILIDLVDFARQCGVDLLAPLRRA